MSTVRPNQRLGREKGFLTMISNLTVELQSGENRRRDGDEESDDENIGAPNEVYQSTGREVGDEATWWKIQNSNPPLKN